MTRTATLCIVALCLMPSVGLTQAIDNTSDALRAALKQKYDVYGEKHREVADRLWRLDGAASAEVLGDWYHRSYSIVSDPTFRFRFVLNAHDDRPAHAGKLIACIVQHKRFAQLDLSSLEEIIEVVNQLADQDIVSDRERRSLTDLRTTEGRNQAQVDQQVERTLADWRARLRASVPLWEGGK